MLSCLCTVVVLVSRARAVGDFDLVGELVGLACCLLLWLSLACGF